FGVAYCAVRSVVFVAAERQDYEALRFIRQALISTVSPRLKRPVSSGRRTIAKPPEIGKA
ncbi:MAG: hypothetical protein V4484_23010, partial [Pseudomonadota bacterium]